ncbi:MAG: cache domain-containing protein [Candidatus Scalindua sp.]|nr:cache domain-containing protein [Candidatus Scalindua sp.]
MKRLFKESIVIITITLIFFSLLPLMLFRIVAFPNAKDELKQHVKTNLNEALLKQKSSLTLFLEERKSHARSISDAIQSTELIYGYKDFVSIIDEGNEQEYLRLKAQMECAKTDYGYKGIFVCDAAGKIHLATLSEKSLTGMDIMKENTFKLEGMNIVRHNPFQVVKKTLHDGKPHISGITHFSVDKILHNKIPVEPYRPWKSMQHTPDILPDEEQDEEPSLFISYPIKGPDHQVTGAVLLWMEMSMLDDVMKNFVLGKTGETYLVNEDGTMITESKFSSHHLKDANDACKTCHRVQDPYTNMLTRGVAACVTEKATGHNLEGYHDYGGIKVVGAWSWLKDLDMGLMVEIDADEAFVTVNNINTMIKSLMLMIIIPAIVIASLVHRKMSVGYMIKNMALPKKTLIGAAVIVTVGFLTAIMDGYQLNKERGYGREQQYKISNPFSVFGEIGAINFRKRESFIEDNIQEFKREYRNLRFENILPPEDGEEEIIKEENSRRKKK